MEGGSGGRRSRMFRQLELGALAVQGAIASSSAVLRRKAIIVTVGLKCDSANVLFEKEQAFEARLSISRCDGGSPPATRLIGLGSAAKRACSCLVPQRLRPTSPGGSMVQCCSLRT